MQRKRSGLLEIAAVLVAVAVFLVAGGVLQHVFRDPDEEARDVFLASLAAMRGAPPPSVTFRTGDREVLIRDPEQVVEFLSLLVEPEAVSSHHSHAAAKLRFELAGDRNDYLLGRDSKMPDKFWLRTSVDDVEYTLKQLRSAELDRWLASHRIAFAPEE